MTQQAMAMGIDMILLAPEYLQDRSPNGLVARLRSAGQRVSARLRCLAPAARTAGPPPLPDCMQSGLSCWGCRAPQVCAFGWSQNGPAKELIEGSGLDGWVEGPTWGAPINVQQLAQLLQQMHVSAGPGKAGPPAAVHRLASPTCMRWPGPERRSAR
jgi:hypothetical protein